MKLGKNADFFYFSINKSTLLIHYVKKIVNLYGPCQPSAQEWKGKLVLNFIFSTITWFLLTRNLTLDHYMTRMQFNNLNVKAIRSAINSTVHP